MGMVVIVVKQIKKMKNHWFCELCSLIILSQVHVSDLASKFGRHDEENLVDMMKSQNSENSKETHGYANSPVKNNTTMPVEKESETIEFDTRRHIIIVEENIHLKRQNKEL